MPDITTYSTYYDVTVLNWSAIGTTTIVVALIFIAIVLAYWLRTKRRKT